MQENSEALLFQYWIWPYYRAMLIFFLKAVLFLHRHHNRYLRSHLKEPYYCGMLLTSNALLPSIVMETKLIYCKG